MEVPLQSCTYLLYIPEGNRQNRRFLSDPKNLVFENQLFQIWKSAHKTLNFSDVFGIFFWIFFALDSQAFPLVANNLEPVFVDKRNRFEELVLVQILKYFNPSFGGNKVQSPRRIFIGTEKKATILLQTKTTIFFNKKRFIFYLNSQILRDYLRFDFLSI